MAILITLQGPEVGRFFPLHDAGSTSIGRQFDCAICLESPAVSRSHAHIIGENGRYFIEDLGSSNGSFLNGERLKQRKQLTETDTLQIGPYQLALRQQAPAAMAPSDPIVRAQVNALSSSQSFFSTNPSQKLQVLLEISRSLGRTLEVKPLLGKVLEQLFRLFSQADRGSVILLENEQYVIRAQRRRHRLAPAMPSERGGDIETTEDEADFPFSRSIVRRALEHGVGLLSEDVNIDDSLPKTQTLVSLNLRSFLCVPLLGLDRTKLGVIQLDCQRPNVSFKQDDLELLTAVGMQVSGVLENAKLHEERIREERLRQELVLAREIQQSYLPRNFNPSEGSGYELYAHCQPAREVSGDLYDFFTRSDGKLSLFLGDVSGKGMPSALFMIAVRTLGRHLGFAIQGPGELLLRLNNALVEDNPTSLFVTMAHAVFDPRTGTATIASGGHMPPLLRRANGRVEKVDLETSMMMGYMDYSGPAPELTVTLNRGDMLFFYSDGLTEGFAPDRKDQFGTDRLAEVLQRTGLTQPLPLIVEQICQAVSRFTMNPELQDDQTLFFLRRT